ncbi:pyridoxine/pyridoxal/pyridoxamine kinase [Brevibacillus borstelensis]|uniref:pyridoxine/pyridoxal/pyridoxamine kinase n=1 Tax=Brevibacillus borstelensis TaxID=45462 RepID=UPI002E1A8AAE|nr:pyridoxine/pyridoxal/pyridoxamine kinase [Brevibacillus borstelensis]
MQVYKTVTIAGSDSSGGAGIQADLKTFQELGVYGMSALTTIVAQDESWGHHVFPVEPDTVAAQLRTALEVIGADACKTGMLGSIRVIELVAQAIAASGIQTIVIDPVMICKGVDEELHPEVNECLREVLVPLATVVTPNLIEAAKLSGMAPLQSVEEMKEAARRIHRLGPSYVLVKGGGRLPGDKAIDLLYNGSSFDIFEVEKIRTTNTHGAGCSYSAAITAELAKGRSVPEAVATAKAFITEGIRHSFSLRSFVGPTNHSAYRQSKGGN